MATTSKPAAPEAAMTTYETICQSFRAMGVEERLLTPEAKLNELGVESLQVLSMLFDCERAFAVQIPDDALYSWETIHDVVTYLDRVTA
jgi:acyl carrier protein